MHIRKICGSSYIGYRFPWQFSNEGSSIIAAFREICSVPYEEDGVIFDTEHITAQNITEFKDYHGIRLSVPVKMDTIAQVLTMDIGW